jgi:hypothetical protein
MSAIALAKKVFACGLFTFIVGVRRPFSTENGSTTSVTALANSNPRNCSLSKALELVTLSHFKLGGSMESFL